MANTDNEKKFVKPSFSLKEMEEELLETVFSKRNLEFAERRINDERQSEFYKSEIDNWLRTRDEDKLFKTFYYQTIKFEYSCKLYAMPYYCVDHTEIRTMYFAIIPDGKYWWVAKLNGNDVEWYSGHCVERYAQRSLKYEHITNEATLVGKMLIYNEIYTNVPYSYYGKQYNYGISRNGIFIWEICSGCKIKTTFVGRKNLKSHQCVFYNNQLITLNHKLSKMGLSPISPIPVIYPQVSAA